MTFKHFKKRVHKNRRLHCFSSACLYFYKNSEHFSHFCIIFCKEILFFFCFLSKNCQKGVGTSFFFSKMPGFDFFWHMKKLKKTHFQKEEISKSYKIHKYLPKVTYTEDRIKVFNNALLQYLMLLNIKFFIFHLPSKGCNACPNKPNKVHRLVIDLIVIFRNNYIEHY